MSDKIFYLNGIINVKTSFVLEEKDMNFDVIEWNLYIMATTAGLNNFTLPINLKLYNPDSAFIPNFAPMIDPAFTLK